MATIDLTKDSNHRDQSPSRKNKEEPETPGCFRVIVTAQNHVSCFQYTFPLRHLPNYIKALLQRSAHVTNITMELVKAVDNFPYYGNRPLYTLKERMDILGWLQSLGYMPDQGYPEGITKYPDVFLPGLGRWNGNQQTFQTLPEGPVVLLNFVSEDDAGAED